MHDKRIDLLYHVINDTQNTIRFLDTKAGAILVIEGIVVSMLTNGLIAFIDQILSMKQAYHLLIIAWYVLITVLFFGTTISCIYVIKSKHVLISNPFLKKYRLKGVTFLT